MSLSSFFLSKGHSLYFNDFFSVNGVTYISLSIFSAPPSISSPSGTLMIWMLPLVIVLCGTMLQSLRLCSYFLQPIFSQLFRFSHFCYCSLKFTDFFSVSSILLLGPSTQLFILSIIFLSYKIFICFFFMSPISLLGILFHFFQPCSQLLVEAFYYGCFKITDNYNILVILVLTSILGVDIY